MDRLPKEPETLRELTEADLRRSARLIIKIQDEIDWQLRIATQQGDYHLSVMMPKLAHERAAMLQRIGLFMAWKGALGFTLATELYEPDSVWCAGITASEQVACLARIRRNPRPWTVANFRSVEWLEPASIDPVISGLLPRTPRPMAPKEISGLQQWFGKAGRFPAVHVASGEIRGL